MPVLCRLEERAQQVLKTPADAHPSQSAEVWEDTDFKELRPRPAQHRPHGASWHQHRPHQSRKAHLSARRPQNWAAARELPFVGPGDARGRVSRSRRVFPACPLERVGLKATRRVRVECERSWRPAEKCLCQYAKKSGEDVRSDPGVGPRHPSPT